MNKAILSITLFLAIGLAGIGTASAGWGGYCNGPGGWAGNESITYEEMTKFHEATQEIREQLYEKRLEYFEVMNSEAPDKELAQIIWNEIYDLQLEMHEKAVEFGMIKKAE